MKSKGRHQLKSKAVKQAEAEIVDAKRKMKMADPPSIAAWREPSISVGNSALDQIRERLRRAIVDRWDHMVDPATGVDEKTAQAEVRGCEIDLQAFKQSVAAERGIFNAVVAERQTQRPLKPKVQ